MVGRAWVIVGLFSAASGCCCGLPVDEEPAAVTSEETTETPEPPAPPPIPLERLLLGSDRSCETSAQPSAFPEVESLFESPTPEPVRKLREVCGTTAVHYLEYSDEAGARSAVLRMAGAVFRGQQPVRIRPREVLRRGPIVAFVSGEGSVQSTAAALAEQRQFRAALPGRTLVGQVLRGAEPFGGVFVRRGTELSTTHVIRAGWSCGSEPDRPFCEALDRYEGYRSVDPPRDFPVVYLGPCLVVAGTSRTPSLCSLLWSPLGVELAEVDANALPGAVRADTLERLARGAPLSDTARRFADSVIDLGPGRPTDVRNRTRRAPPMGDRVTYIRGTDAEIVAVETVRTATDAELVAVFPLASQRAADDPG